MSRLITEILTSQWLIDTEYARSCAPLLMSLVKGEKIDAKDWGVARLLNRPFVVSKKAGLDEGDDDKFPIPLPGDDDEDESEAQPCKMDDENIPEGSIAIIPIRGEIMKYDEFCGPIGTLTLTKNIKAAIENANIAAIVLVVDSPGGEVSYTDILADTIAQSTIPIIGFVEGLAASAAYWVVSGCQKIICSSDIDRVGSIGTMSSYVDFQPFFEAQGVVFHDFKATKSTDKNADIKDIRAGKYDNYIKNVLDVINTEFLSDVQANRPGVDKSTLSGKMYFAPDAIILGLVDEIGTLEYAIQEANRLANIEPIINNSKNKNMKIKANSTLGALVSFLGFDTAKDNELTEQQLADLNTELQSRGEQITQLSTDAASHKTESDTLKASIANLETQSAARTKEIETLTAQVAELSELPGAAAATLVAEKEANHAKTGGDLNKASDFCKENGDDINACLAELNKVL